MTCPAHRSPTPRPAGRGRHPNTADLTARLTALLEKEYGCKPGQVHEGYGAECASIAHAPALYRTFGCDHAAHVAAVLAEAGVGFVAEAETRRLDMERERNHAEVRAERAEAALAVAYDDGYNDAVTMARCYGHTDHWPEESEPRNPYRADLGGTP